MMKVRRYLRGSGRVLAFVFIASVIWLLFDMAALRMSLNDVNSQLLKESVIREREIFKQQSRTTQLTKRGFKHPVERVDLDGTQAGKGPLGPGGKLAQVYRQGGKRKDQKLWDKKLEGDGLSKTVKPKYVPPEGKDNVPPKQDVPAKKKVVNLDLNETKFKESNIIDGSNKIMLPVAESNKTLVLPGVQENKHASLPTSKKGLLKAGEQSDSKANEKVKDEPKSKTGTKEGQSEAEEARPVKATSKPPQKDVNAEQVTDKAGEKHVERMGESDVNPVKETPKPAVKTQAGNNSESNSKGKSGVHKVLALDATLSPRNPNAVGQFGQAALVSSNEDTEVRKRWDEGHFNVYLSDKIPVDRAIPDTRPEM